MGRLRWRPATYWLLVVASAWLLLAGLFFWVQIEGWPRGIAQAILIGMPAWHLIVPAFGAASLVLLLWQPPGVFGLLAVLALPIVAAAVMVPTVVLDGYQLAWPARASGIVMSVYALSAAVLALTDTVPLTSPLAWLAHAGRLRHLRELYVLARVHGWQALGPEQPGQLVTVRGAWQHRRFLIQSGASYTATTGAGYYLRVAIETQRRPWPVFVGIDSAQPSRRAVIRAQLGRCATSSGRPAVVYLWPPDGGTATQEDILPVQEALEAGCTFLKKRTVVRSLDNGIVFFRWSGWRVQEDAEQLERLVDWLSHLAGIVESPDSIEQPESSPVPDTERAAGGPEGR